MEMMDRVQIPKIPNYLANASIIDRLNQGVENIQAAMGILGEKTAPAEAVTIFIGQPVTGRVICLEDGTIIYHPLRVPVKPTLPDAIVPEPLGGACDCCHGSGRK